MLIYLKKLLRSCLKVFSGEMFRSAQRDGVILLLSLFATLSNAQISSQEANEYVSFLESVTHFSSSDHAGSHGSLGIHVGSGIGSYETPSTAILREHWRAPEEGVGSHRGQGRINVPRLYLTKGLPYPVDLGFAIGQDFTSRAMVASGMVKWTIYESFARPALALRGAYSRLMGLATTDVTGTQVEGVASYGFLRFFTLYGALGLGRYESYIRSGGAFGTSLSLNVNDQSEEDFRKTELKAARTFGLQIQILPPFWTTTLEMTQLGLAPRSYLAKLSVGI